ncbi:hypothetical protein JXB02_03395 [Candidatus Woesearchaeota archaeon]|nr:hypothetical protein [Candidatus Woesearchaeota archaeon]
MIDIGTALRHYKRRDIQEAILATAHGREVAVKFGTGFGKRPDMLQYPADVLEFAKQRATSFHISEERWSNVLQLKPQMSAKELESLRIGWDLVIDVDFEEFSATRLIADAIVQALKDHGIRAVSCKFSGNKGFHIGVPYEAFAKGPGDTETRKMFPDMTRRIVAYLMDCIDSKENRFSLSKRILADPGFRRYLQETGKTQQDFFKESCASCGAEAKGRAGTARYEFICPKCQYREMREKDERFLACGRCGSIMEKMVHETVRTCRCGSTSFEERLDLKVDTLLISSRHLYRSAYSLHEKSGLVSVPVDPDRVLEFERESAAPDGLDLSPHTFLDPSRATPDEARELVIRAFDHSPRIEATLDGFEKRHAKEFEELEEAAPLEAFPPCMRLGLAGLKDGKKRFMFCLVNFLQNVGWTHEMIEEALDEWNAKNPEQLRKVVLKGQLSYRKNAKEKVLPPNCDNRTYYIDLGICHPDNLCVKIKNPVQYVRRKLLYSPARRRKARRAPESEPTGQPAGKP